MIVAKWINKTILSDVLSFLHIKCILVIEINIYINTQTYSSSHGAKAKSKIRKGFFKHTDEIMYYTQVSLLKWE
jgi:hypothetical protein